MTKERNSFQRVQTDTRGRHVINNNGLEGYPHHNPAQYYEPTPAPTTVIVHSVPNKTNGACCWGCYFPLLLVLQLSVYVSGWKNVVPETQFCNSKYHRV